MFYVLMRKNDKVLPIQIDDYGRLVLTKYGKIKNPELLPLHRKSESNNLIRWWNERSVPLKQGKVAKMLEEKNLSCPEEYLKQNLGLSLTDYYWIKPTCTDLRWEDVNLYDNPFLNEFASSNSVVQNSYTPNSSLQGTLEKKWCIIDDDRYLVKGNSDNLSAESINEVFASIVHERQGYKSYTPYQLIRIKNSSYDYGCISKMFTSQKLELVPAFAVVTSEKSRNDVSSYEHFINVCMKHGLSEDEVRPFLEYQIMIDFIISNRDRHLDNVGVLRDADTLKFMQMAPIYDSGGSLFVGKDIPNARGLLSIETTSFASNELKLLSYVRDRNLVDVSALPDKRVLQELYLKDSQMSEGRIKSICEAYERKVDLFRDFQLGKDLNKIKLSFTHPKRLHDVNDSYVFSKSIE